MIFIILRPITSLASITSRIKGMSTRPPDEAQCLLSYNTAGGRKVPWAELGSALHRCFRIGLCWPLADAVLRPRDNGKTSERAFLICNKALDQSLRIQQRDDGHREFPPAPFRAFHARHAAETRSGKSDRLFQHEHEWGCQASARSDKARQKRSRLPREVILDRRVTRPATRRAESTFRHEIPSHKLPSPKPDHSIQYTVSHVTMDWLSVLLSNLLEQAYGLDLEKQIFVRLFKHWTRCNRKHSL
jgi:hypothetical protein